MKKATLWLPYTQMQTADVPLEVVATQNTTLILNDGRQLIDSLASWWTACHGYNHPHLVQAIKNQAAFLPHVMMGGLIHPQVKKLSQRIAALLPAGLNHVFFSESGSVSVEIAMKMALQYWQNQRMPHRTQFVSFEYGYHGDTFYTMSICDPVEGMHRLFQGVLPAQFCRLIPTTVCLLEAFGSWLSENADNVAAVIIEPLVQGAGGMKMHDAATLKAIAQICKQHHTLLIADEIFTGFGRTGTMFACDQAPIVPDIICLSKALTGGTLPLAATIACDTIYQAFLGKSAEKALMHGSTFMGNALACAAANASLDLFESEPRLAQVLQIEKILKSELQDLVNLPGVKAVRIKGAIGAVQLERPLGEDFKWFSQQFIELGIWNRPLGDIIYTTPAFTIEPADLFKITAAINLLVTKWSTSIYTTPSRTFLNAL